jgi:hypothetical protein
MASQILRPTIERYQETNWLVKGPWGQRAGRIEVMEPQAHYVLCAGPAPSIMIGPNASAVPRGFAPIRRRGHLSFLGQLERCGEH